ncbi:winged helix-turn-helix transcriptional regulator [Leucobacter chromiireducens]|uniref:winged helix-turn-helix transcriptional regulator n=1 Tax=Leucobacter chromiireducens TaxID=283877 RepID=UPI000F641030|nr:response regulator transcription factor [Leucobacter chromiireducens]
MELLCLTDRDPGESLPGLDLLPHELRTSPLALHIPETLAARYDAILIDGTLDARRARSACLSLASGVATPRVVILPEVALTALTSEWGVSELLLPTASPAEIELRLRLLEQQTSAQTPPPAVQAAGVVIDESNFTARLFGRPLDLTYKEFELLHFLAGHPGRVFTREQLLSEVWGTDYFGGTRTVDVHVRRLRAKLGDHEGLISTVRGVGYGFARARPVEDEEDTDGAAH